MRFISSTEAFRQTRLTALKIMTVVAATLCFISIVSPFDSTIQATDAKSLGRLTEGSEYESIVMKDRLENESKRLAVEAAEDPCRNTEFTARVPLRADRKNEVILVTGGSGFIGSNLVDTLLDIGYKVRVLDNLDTGYIEYLELGHPNLEVMFGDIQDVDTVYRAMEGVEGVFHLAAASKVVPSLKDPSMATFNVARNAVGTANVLEAAAKSTTKIKKFIYAASSTYYGNQPVPFAESDPFMPTSPYAASKYMGELQLLTYDKLYDLPAVNLRYFMVYGPRQPRTGPYAIVTGKFVDQLASGLPLTIEGDGTHYRDFIHVEDLVRGMLLAYQNPAVRSSTINLGSGEKYSVKQVADIVSSSQLHVPERKNDLVGTLANTCLAKQVLGFGTQKQFLVEMKKLVENTLRHDGDGSSRFWTHPDVVRAIETRIPQWRTLDFEERNMRLKQILEADGEWLDALRSVYLLIPQPV